MKVPTLEQASKFIKYADYDAAARIALTHSFILPDIRAYAGQADFTLKKWKNQLGLRDYFSQKIGKSIYEVLDGVVEMTFEFNPMITDK